MRLDIMDSAKREESDHVPLLEYTRDSWALRDDCLFIEFKKINLQEELGVYIESLKREIAGLKEVNESHRILNGQLRVEITGAKQSLPKHIFWQEEKEMKLAEHKLIEADCLDGTNQCPHYASDEDCKGECPLIHAEDCPRCSQLSLLQQIVDDLRGHLLRMYLAVSDEFAAGGLEEIIKEYEAIIEGSK